MNWKPVPFAAALSIRSRMAYWFDLRAVAVVAVVVRDRREREAGQRQRRRIETVVELAGLLVTQPRLDAQLQLVAGRLEQMHREASVGGVGPFLVGVDVVLVGEAGQRIAAGIVDVEATRKAEDREIRFVTLS